MQQLDKIKQLESALVDLENKFNAESGDNTKILINDAIRELNAELEKLKETLKNLVSRTEENESSLNVNCLIQTDILIFNLFNLKKFLQTNKKRLNILDDTKMDKNWILNEIKNVRFYFDDVYYHKKKYELDKYLKL